VVLIKTDYEEGDCSQLQLATPSWLPHFSSFPMIFWRKNLEKKTQKLMKKDLEKKCPRLRQTMKKGDCSHPQLATRQLATPRAKYFLLVLISIPFHHILQYGIIRHLKCFTNRLICWVHLPFL
jgi:hypothetical protein